MTPEENRRRIALLHADEGPRDGRLGGSSSPRAEHGFLAPDDARYMLTLQKQREQRPTGRKAKRRYPSDGAMKVA